MIGLQLKRSSSWINRSFETTIENKSFSGEKTLQHENETEGGEDTGAGGGEDHLENHIKTFR